VTGERFTFAIVVLERMKGVADSALTDLSVFATRVLLVTCVRYGGVGSLPPLTLIRKSILATCHFGRSWDGFAMYVPLLIWTQTVHVTPLSSRPLEHPWWLFRSRVSSAFNRRDI
jgi:hypothetical protein